MSFIAGTGKTNVDILSAGLKRLPQLGEELYSDGFKPVSYTHLRTHYFHSSFEAYRHTGRNSRSFLGVCKHSLPVSYTHLDVYKRQSILSRSCASISRFATASVSSNKRSASVLLPWSIWAIMQKFLM